MFVWLAVVSVPAMLPAVKLPVTFKFPASRSETVNCDVVPSATIFPVMVKSPSTVNPIKSPTSVMFGWLAVCSVPVNLAAVTAPVVDKLPVTVLPVTVKLVNVPTRVMLVC